MKRSPKKNSSPQNSFKILGGISNKATFENKINYVALMMNYFLEYGINVEYRVINLTGEIDERQFEIVDAGMTIMEKLHPRKDVTLKINSEGGSTYQAMAIIGRIKESSCKVITKGYGQVLSAATLILASGTRKRMISEEAAFMWHEASYNPGNARVSQHEDTLEQVKKEEKIWCARMAERTNMDAEFWAQSGVRKDDYFNAEQLLEFGVVDEIF